MPIDMVARGVARITLDRARTKMIYYAGDLKKRNTAREARQAEPPPTPISLPQQREPNPFDLIDDDTPFGWTPPGNRDER